MDSTYQTEAFNSGLGSSNQQIIQARFMNRTYGWMFFGLLLTAGVSLAIASSESAVRFILENKWVFFGVMIAELIVVVGLSAAHKSMNRGLILFNLIGELK